MVIEKTKIFPEDNFLYKKLISRKKDLPKDIEIIFDVYHSIEEMKDFVGLKVYSNEGMLYGDNYIFQDEAIFSLKVHYIDELYTEYKKFKSKDEMVDFIIKDINDRNKK